MGAKFIVGHVLHIIHSGLTLQEIWDVDGIWKNSCWNITSDC
jgi:hypothetical protein